MLCTTLRMRRSRWMPSMNTTPSQATPAAEPAPDSSLAPTKGCPNCGAPMLGPFCHACGQPEKGMIRHLASVMSDMADTLFNVDSRIFRTLPALFLRPGFLTNEYFAGRRTRYVTPFRLFFFLCLIAFFAIQVGTSISSVQTLRLDGDEGATLEAIESAQTPEAIDEATAKYVTALETARSAARISSQAVKVIEGKIAAANELSRKRHAFLVERAAAIAAGKPTPPDPAVSRGIEFDGVPWQPTAESTRVSWLPDFANAQLLRMAQRTATNLRNARNNPSHLIEGVFSVLPQTMFVLMPLLALLLKIAYVFKRRLYMEHFLVALHAHAFVFLSLLLLVLLHLITGWASLHATWLWKLCSLLSAAIWVWIFVYPLLMAKRVYRQGWFMTTLKYLMVGLGYLILLGFGLAGAIIASLAAS